MAKAGNKYWAGGMIVTAVMAVTLLLAIGGMLDPLENAGYDWRMQATQSASEAPAEIAVVLVDDASLKSMEPQLGQWPWPASAYSDLIAFLKQGGARAIAFDLPVGAALGRDEQLINTSRDARTVIYPMELRHEAGIERGPAMPDNALQFAISGKNRERYPNNAYTLPPDPLIQGALGLGVANLAADGDGVVRRSHYYKTYQGQRLPTLGSAPLLFADVRQTLLQRDEPEQLIHFYGRFQTYPAATLLTAAQQLKAGEGTLAIAPETFRNRIVFIGSSAAALGNLMETPLAAETPRAVVHAALTATLLEPWQLHRSSVTTVVWITLVMSLLVCLMVLGVKRPVMKVAGPLLLAAFYVAFALFAFHYNYVMALAPVLIAFLLTLLASGAYLLLGRPRTPQP